MKPPLQGIRILDFTRVLSGPFCTALLADLGAEVVKIEPPHGDEYRHIGPFKEGESALFSVVNRNKKSVVLDLTKPESRALVAELAQQCDVVVENFRPGVAAKLQIDYATLAALNPKLIYVSISGFGQTGPDAHKPAYDIVMQALCGLMENTGDPDGAPTMVGEAATDVLTGMFASWATLAALFQREREGGGQHIDVAMFDATLTFLVTSVARYLFTGKAPKRSGNRHPLSAPFGAFSASNGFYVLAVLNDKLFHSMLDAMSLSALKDDVRFKDDSSRALNEAALRAAVEGWSASRTVIEVVAAMNAVGVPVAPIATIADALASAQADARQVLRPVTHSRVADLSLPTQPAKFSGHAPAPIRGAPDLGEHSAEVLSQWLGHSAEKIAALKKIGVLK
jgi:CoA:oxalate CoA-transferase